MNKPRLPARPALRGLMFLLTALFAGGLVASLWAQSAYAENTLASSNPALGETLDSFAGPITLTFTNQLGTDNSFLQEDPVR